MAIDNFANLLIGVFGHTNLEDPATPGGDEKT
jgi:hypothetical protein